MCMKGKVQVSGGEVKPGHVVCKVFGSYSVSGSCETAGMIGGMQVSKNCSVSAWYGNLGMREPEVGLSM